MANENKDISVQLTAGQRASGLNHIASLRSQLWGDTCGDELKRFMSDMRRKSDPQYEENKRVLGAILFLANISKDRHQVAFNELTSDEKLALIGAMNQLRAVVSLFPKKLSLPN